MDFCSVNKTEVRGREQEERGWGWAHPHAQNQDNVEAQWTILAFDIVDD
jgi:hypothetical protein